MSINQSRNAWVWSRFPLLNFENSDSKCILEYSALCILKCMHTLCLALSHDVGRRMSCTFLTLVTQLRQTLFIRKTLEHFSCHSAAFLNLLYHVWSQRGVLNSGFSVLGIMLCTYTLIFELAAVRYFPKIYITNLVSVEAVFIYNLFFKNTLEE